MASFKSKRKDFILKNLRKLIPLLFLIFIASWSIYPIIQKPTTSYFQAGDDALIAWVLNQTIQKIPKDLENIFESNIFYPYKNTLAFTNLNIPSAAIGYLPYKLTDSPFIVYNLTIIFTQLLSSIILYLWLKALTNNSLASVVGTLSFILSNFRMQSIAHIHVFMMHWLFISICLIWLYKKSKKIKYLYLSSIFFIIQAWESFYHAYWIILIGLILLIPEIRYLKKQFKHVLTIILIVLLSAYPVIYTYIQIVRQFDQAISIRNAAHFSMSLNDVWGKYLSIGIYLNLILALILIGKKFFIEKRMWFPFVLLLLGLILSLGPVLKLYGATFKIFGNLFIPLPYSLFYYLLPGFSGLRSVDRFFGISYIGMAMIIAISLSLIHKRKKYFISICFLLIAIFGGKRVENTYYFPLPNDYPKVYSWIASQPGNIILEYPVFLWSDRDYSFEMYRMLFSLKHNKYLINGASGFVPPERLILFENIKANFPNPTVHQQLKNIGVNYVVVHKDEINKDKLKSFDLDSHLEKVYEDNNDNVYSYKIN